MENHILYASDNYPGYLFSKNGDVYKCQGDKVTKLKPIQRSKKEGKKYTCVSIKDKDGVKKIESIHRVIAKVFIPNPHNYPIINHKDENPANNSVDNLEWCTYKYNNNYGSAPKKMREGLEKTWKIHSIPIVATNERNFKLTFDSGADAARFFGCGKSTIWRHIKKGMPYKGYTLTELAQRKEIEYG